LRLCLHDNSTQVDHVGEYRGSWGPGLAPEGLHSAEYEGEWWEHTTIGAVLLTLVNSNTSANVMT